MSPKRSHKPAPPPPARILIVEDEAIVVQDLTLALEHYGYAVVGTAASGEQALQQLTLTPADLVLMDIVLKGEMDGIQASEAIAASSGTPVVFLSAHSDEATLQRALASEPFGYLLKPFQEKDLRSTVEVALARSTAWRLDREKAREGARFAELSRALLGTSSLEEINRITLDCAQDLTGSPVGLAGYLSPGTGVLHVAVQGDESCEMCRNSGQAATFEKTSGLLGWPLKEKKSLWTNAPSADPRSTGLPEGHFPLHCFAGVPALDREDVVGMIGVANAPSEYGPTTVALLERVAAQYALALRRLQAVDRLAHSERQLSNLMANLPGMAYRCANAPDWPMEFVSEGCRLLTGYSAEAVMANTPVYGGLILPEDREPVWQDVQRALASKRPYLLYYRIRHASGGVRFVWEQGRGVWAPSGELEALEGFVADVTAEERARRALTASEERYRAFVSNFPGIAFRFTPENNWWDFFEGDVEAITGFPLEALARKKKQWSTLICDEDREACLAAFDRMRATPGRFERLQFRFAHPSVHPRWLRGYAVSGAGESGGSPFIQGALLDVTDEIESELALQKSEQLLNKTERISSLGSWELDHQTDRLEWSAQVCRLFEVTPTEMGNCYDAWLQKVHPADRDGVDLLFKRSVADHSPYQALYRVLFPDGRTKWMEEQGETTYAEDGRPLRSLGTVQDVTSRVTTEAAVASARHLNDQILASVGDGILGLDPQGQITFVNPGALAILGMEREELLGQRSHDILCHENGQGAPLPPEECLGHKTLATGQAHHATGELLHRRDGRAIPVDMTCTPIVESGRIEGAALSFQDITPRLTMERALRESREKYRAIIEVTSDWIWEVDPEARYTYASPQVLGLLGYSPEEVLGKTPYDFMAPEEATRVRAGFEEIASERRPFSFMENTNLHKDGYPVILETSGIPMFDSEGVFTGYCGTDRDVTQKRMGERERTRLATAIRSAQETIVVTDRQGVILYANPAFERVTGYKVSEALGANPRVLKSGKHDAAFYQQMWAELLAGRIWRGEIWNKKKDETLYLEEATISPIFSTEGEIDGFVAVKRDVTEERALQERLLKAQELERLGRLVGGVAHEVRNPLNAIQACVEALQLDLGRDEEHGPMLDVIRAQVTRMADLMRDLLSLGKPLPPPQLWERVPLAGVAEKAVSLWRQTHGDATAGLTVSATTKEAHTFGVPLYLEQVVVNLLDNALQSSKPGAEIRLETGIEEDGPILRVWDRGKGVPPEILDRIFDPFFTTRRAGTGLGLALVRHIVELHGGHVSLANRSDGPGCVATVVLPRKIGPGEAKELENGGG